MGERSGCLGAWSCTQLDRCVACSGVCLRVYGWLVRARKRWSLFGLTSAADGEPPVAAAALSLIVEHARVGLCSQTARRRCVALACTTTRSLAATCKACSRPRFLC
eukprot:6179975-Pleurochrysis_carterae.AAC.1